MTSDGNLNFNFELNENNLERLGSIPRMDKSLMFRQNWLVFLVFKEQIFFQLLATLSFEMASPFGVAGE